MRFIRYTIVLVIGLTGCNSFNTYDVAVPNHHQTIKTTDIPGLIAKGLEAEENPASGAVTSQPELDKTLCPQIKLTSLPPPPPLPVEELKKISPNDKDAINQLLADHVDALRKYISDQRTQDAAQKRKYLLECRKWQQLHSQ